MTTFRFSCLTHRPSCPTTPLIRTTVSHEPDVVRVGFAGDIDTDTADTFVIAVLQTLHASRQPRLDIDLAQVGFLASAGVQALVDCYATTAQQRRRLTVSHAQPLVRRILEVTAVADLLSVEPPVLTRAGSHRAPGRRRHGTAG